MRPSVRGKSNPKQPLPSTVMEQETQKMEEKLLELKRVMQQQKEKQQQTLNQSGSRWKMGSDQKPIKNFAEIVVANHQSKQSDTTAKPSSATNPQQPTIKNPVPPTTGVPPIIPNDAQISRPVSNQSATRGKENVSDENQSIPLNEQIGGPQTNNYIINSSNAQKNLQRAINLQKDGPNQAKQFLDSINLPQYLKIFHDNGFEEFDIIKQIDTQMLNSMKIPAGHQIKIMKQIKQMVNGPSTAAPIQPNNVVTSSRPYSGKRTDLVELEVPKQSPLKGTKSSAVSSSSSTTETGEKGGQLLQGQFDQKESHASFLEALSEWRNQKPATNNSNVSVKDKENKEKKSVRFGNDVENNEDKSNAVAYVSSKNKKQTSENGKKGLFFMQDGGSDWQNQDIPQGISGETQTEQKPIEKQQSCWSCYKLIPVSQIINQYNQVFCQEACIDQFLKSEQMTCGQCQQKAFQDEGIYKHGGWYCGEKCAPSMEEVMINWKKEELRKQKELGASSLQNSGVSSTTQSSNSNLKEKGNLDTSFNKSEQQTEPIEIDLTIRESQILSLAELENQYQKINTENEQLANSSLLSENKSQVSVASTQQKVEVQNVKPTGNMMSNSNIKKNSSMLSNQSDVFQDSLQM